MRKVTEKMANALKAQRATHSGNDAVTVSYEQSPDGEVLVARAYLHGNNIATYGNGLLTLNDCGWQTNTTKERLNGILDTFGISGGISQRDYQWYFVDGHWTNTPTDSNPYDGHYTETRRDNWDSMVKQWEVA